jgi:hypothetical protein
VTRRACLLGERLVHVLVLKLIIKATEGERSSIVSAIIGSLDIVFGEIVGKHDPRKQQFECQYLRAWE